MQFPVSPKPKPKVRLFVAKWSRTPILISLLINFLMILALLTVYFGLQPEVPIFYSLARPSQHLVSKDWLFVLPALSLVINLIHFSLLGLMKKIDRILLKLFVWATVGIQLLLGTALARILLIIA